MDRKAKEIDMNREGSVLFGILMFHIKAFTPLLLL